MSHQLSNAQYAAIGRVATQAARLDSLIEGFLADALTHDTDVAIVAIRGMFFERKVEMLGEILAIRVPKSEEWEQLKPALSQAKQLMKDRNLFLHGLWQFDADANLEVRSRVRRTGKFAARSVSVEELAETANRIGAIAEEIEDLYLDMLVDIGVYRPLGPGVWRRVPSHRPHLTPEQVQVESPFLIALSGEDDQHV